MTTDTAETTGAGSTGLGITPKKQLAFNFRLLAFGALASDALFKDLRDRNPAVFQVANTFHTDPNPANFVKNGQDYLKALGFPAKFVDSTTTTEGLPWIFINHSGIMAIRAVLEADSLYYPDGGCFGAVTAAIDSVGKIMP